MTTLKIDWTIEDGSEQAFSGPAQSTELKLSDVLETYRGEDISDLDDEDLEQLVLEHVNSDFNGKISPVVDTDQLAAHIAAMRDALEKARTS